MTVYDVKEALAEARQLLECGDTYAFKRAIAETHESILAFIASGKCGSLLAVELAKAATE